MVPPDFTDVPGRIADWLDSVNAVPTDARPVAVAIAERHAAFERIHPFLDGNGRTGRLLLNLVLVRLGYPPAIIQKRERPRYLEALDRADHGVLEPLGEVIARGILDNLTRFVLPAIAGPAKLVPLEALAEKGRTALALRAAAERGRLRAVRGDDGTWRSSRNWLNEYVDSLHKRRPSPQLFVPLSAEEQATTLLT